MNTNELHELVKKEAENLLKYATKEERLNLNFGTLNGNNENRCIYGQMTGNCFEARSLELIQASCEKVYKHNTSILVFDSVTLNGPPKNYDLSSPYDRSKLYFSPIEVFIYRESKANQKRLVEYLRGESKELVFE